MLATKDLAPSSSLDFFLKKLSTASLCGLKTALIQQMHRDINKYFTEEEELFLRKDIEEVIRKEELEIRPRKKELCLLKALATYATSYHEYGPVLSDWVESLLNTALIENRKLIFIARDGIAPYKAAQILREKFPNRYQNVSVHLVYLSRTLVYCSLGALEKISRADLVVKQYASSLKQSDPFLLKDYLQQEADLNPKEKCLFVDIGFAGSINPFVEKQLKSLSLDVRFSFLISHTKKSKVQEEKHRAWGFLAHSEERPLEVVNKAGKNPAIHWLEDTHQSVIKSPKILIRKGSKIEPAIVRKEGEHFVVEELLESFVQTCRNSPGKFLVKWYGLKGALEAVKKHEVQENILPWKQAEEERREQIGAFLQELYSRNRFLLIKHN
jgi:hypothetical protein